MSTLTQEARYALRQLRKSPGFTTLVLGTLALGIGASTAMFGVMNAVLLRPLPFRESERLVRVLSTRNGAFAGPSPLDVRDFAAANRTFDQLVVFDAWRKNVSIANRSVEPEQRPVGLVPAGYFEALDIKPLFGRVFSNEEQRWGNQFEARYPMDHGLGVLLRPLQEDQSGNLRPVVLLLMGAVILILLIACSNVANLLLARNSARTREI